MKTVKTVDVDRFADVFGIERNIAYGFLRFIADAKLVPTGKRPQPKGKKGKPATLFHLDAGLGERLVAHLEHHLGQVEDVALVEEVVAIGEPESPTSVTEQGPATTSENVQ